MTEYEVQTIVLATLAQLVLYLALVVLVARILVGTIFWLLTRDYRSQERRDLDVWRENRQRS